MKNRIDSIKQLAASLLRKPRSWSKKQQLIAGLALVFALMGFAGGAAWTDHANDVRADNELAKRQEEARLAEEQRTALEQAQSKQKQQDDQKSENQVQQSSPETKKEITKYSTSSDPRSTDYSTTPPAPSFDIKITHTGQVAPGTLISYNATKGDKTYYAGDLSTGPSSVTLPKSCNTTTNVIVTIPDGVVSSMPNEWWSDVLPSVYMAFDSNAATTGTSFSIIVGCNPGAPVGSYRLHIVPGPVDPARDNWVYHGFITVNVVD